MEIFQSQDEFIESLKAEFGVTERSDDVYRVSHECNNVQNGGRKTCPVTGIRCKRINGCESAASTRNLDGYHGDSTTGK